MGWWVRAILRMQIKLPLLGTGGGVPPYPTASEKFTTKNFWILNSFGKKIKLPTSASAHTIVRGLYKKCQEKIYKNKITKNKITNHGRSCAFLSHWCVSHL